MQTTAKKQLSASAGVIMEKTKFDDIFGAYSDADWHFAQIEPTSALVQKEGQSFLLIDADAPLLKQKNHPLIHSHTIVLIAQKNVHQLIDLLNLQQNLHHVLCLSSTTFKEQLIRLLTQISTPNLSQSFQFSKLKNMKRETISSYGEKNRILTDIQTYATKMEGFKDLPSTAATIASEMMMNAVFDAPIDHDTKQPKYANLPRSQKLTLTQSERIDLAYGVEERFFVLSVRDHFGSLDRSKIVSNLHRCAKQSEDQIRKTQGGAGVGLYLLLNLCTQLDIYINPGLSTEVVAYISASKRQKDYELQGAAINIFVNGVKT